MGFRTPELLLLALPMAVLWYRSRTGHPVTQILRLIIGAALCLALAGPYLETASRGRDLVLVIDRSRSMPAGTDKAIAEMIRLAEAARGSGDQLGIVTFGAEPKIERALSGAGIFQVYEHEVDGDGSDLGRALETALELIPSSRRGGVLVLSDGENNGREPLDAARRANARGLQVDVRHYSRSGQADLSVERIDLPEVVGEGEPFQFTAWVHSDRDAVSNVVLKRGSTVLSSGPRQLTEGLNRILFRDVLPGAGTAAYSVEVTQDEDRVPENNRGVAALRVEGRRSVLVVNNDGQSDSLVQALNDAGLQVRVASPDTVSLDPVFLSSFRTVILENVSANRIQRDMPSLRTFVLDLGGGLLVTGGKASFGVGGYFRSALDELLPVSMELRQDHRKQGVALAVVMDRSGSMSVGVAGGLTKMDLANLGTVAAIELLSPLDSVAVIAVDSAPHLIQPLTAVTNVAALTSRVRSIESMGGGIFVHSGLLAAGKELETAPQQNRHIILFSDAADSEEQAGCPALLEEFAKRNITVSVIALGTEADSDAQFLKDVARLGSGDVYFSTDPNDLPRLFANDTLKVARSTFIEEPTACKVLPDLFSMGELASKSFPTIAGYNLTYLRDGAFPGVVTQDEYQAPIFAFSYKGLGRTAAFAGQVGGSFGQEIVQWDSFATFFVTLTRWLAGQEPPEEFFASVRRDGREGVVSVEVDPNAPRRPDTSLLKARLVSEQGEPLVLPMERVGEHRFEARFPLRKEGISVGTVQLDERRFVNLPPIALPYSPEFERSADPRRGERLLRGLAEETGGRVEPAASELFQGDRDSRTWRGISRELMLAALLLALVEIAGRRLSLWGSLALPEPVKRAGARAGDAVQTAVARIRSRPTRRRTEEAPVAEPSGGDAQPQADEPSVQQPDPAPPVPKPGVAAALKQAKRRAGRRLDR